MSGDSGVTVVVEEGEIEQFGAHLVPGDLVDGIYQLTKTLGEGAMGRIFEAQDLLLKRRVAIKVALIAEAVEVLIAEARALAALRHPNLPVVHAAGRFEQTDYLVMERLHGVDLDKHVAEIYEAGYCLPLGDALDLLIRITDALRAIHHAGIAHRDIKPENVLLCKRGPVLIDFGLVAAASANDAIHGGSPCYVAPEIIRRDSERSSRHLADIYSLGILAYELLTGEVPFDADDVMAVLRLHLDAPIPDVRSRRPDLPAPLAEMIVEMMAKQPGERPSAEEVLWTLRSLSRSVDPSLPPKHPAVLVVSEDAALCGKIGRLIQGWAPEAKVGASRTIDAALTNLAKQEPYLLIVDCSKTMGVELLMQLGSSTVRRPAVVTLIEELHTADFALLRRFAAHCVVPMGDGMAGELHTIVRNVLSPRPADG